MLGAAAAAGLRLYATVAVLGLLGRSGVVALPGGLAALQQDWVILTAAFLYLVEFLADKVPLVDSAWDFVHTFLRVPAAALLAWAALVDVPEEWRVLAALIGGGVAFSAHGLKAGTRAVLNTSPEPFTNWIASLTEDGVALFFLYLAVRHPVAAAATAAAVVFLALVLGAWVWRAVRRVFAPGRTASA